MSAETAKRSNDAAKAPNLRVMLVMECTIGGTRRHITDLALGMAQEGVEVHLVVAAERQPDFRQTLVELAREGCTVHELPMRREISLWADLRHLLAVARLLRDVRPDIVHTHSSKAGVLGRVASILTGIGVRLHTPHTFAFLFSEMFSPTKRRVFFLLEKQLAKRTQRLIAVSASEARTFVSCQVVAAERISVVPNGIEPSAYAAARPVDLAALGLDPSRPTAAIVGLLNVAKGQDLALRALAQPTVPQNLQLLIAGHGEMERELTQLAGELGVSERVAFLGFRRDVPALLAACDFLLLPSRWEGMPYIVLEAMAAGLPVLATPVDGALDLIEPGKTGWLAKNISAEAIAQSLKEVLALSHDERAATGERARARVLEKYSRRAMVQALLDLYSALRPRSPS